MKRGAKFLTGGAAVVAALWMFGPYESLSPERAFDASVLENGVDTYLKAGEVQVDGIRPGAEKRVIWAAASEQQTPWAIVYVHGFSASAAEIQPVPEKLAQALGANLYYTRLRGHGRDGAALGAARADQWIYDMQEAMAIGRRIGAKVLLLSTSTGGSLATLIAADPEHSHSLAAAAFVSPNFGVNNAAAPLLTWPAARHWLPVLAGRERGFAPRNDAQAAGWTTQYPSTAVFPMAAVTRAAWQVDHADIATPALFVFHPDDQVVRADRTAEVTTRWGGPVSVFHPQPGPQDDPDRHVIAGDIMSPDATPAVTEALINWALTLE